MMKFSLLKVPKFKIEYDQTLNKTLHNLGIKGAFDKYTANFSGISSNALVSGNRLYVSKAIHKAFIETSEEGTEAAAATAIEMFDFECEEIYPEPHPFIVNHPFLFLIKHKNQTLFMGKVNSL